MFEENKCSRKIKLWESLYRNTSNRSSPNNERRILFLAPERPQMNISSLSLYFSFGKTTLTLINFIFYFSQEVNKKPKFEWFFETNMNGGKSRCVSALFTDCKLSVPLTTKLRWLAQQHACKGRWMAAVQLFIDNGLFLRNQKDVALLAPVSRTVLRTCYFQLLTKWNLHAFQAIKSLTQSTYVKDYFPLSYLANSVSFLATELSDPYHSFYPNTLTSRTEEVKNEKRTYAHSYDPKFNLDKSLVSYQRHNSTEESSVFPREYSLYYDHGERSHIFGSPQMRPIGHVEKYNATFTPPLLQYLRPLELLVEWLRRKCQWQFRRRKIFHMNIAQEKQCDSKFTQDSCNHSRNLQTIETPPKSQTCLCNSSTTIESEPHLNVALPSLTSVSSPPITAQVNTDMYEDIMTQPFRALLRERQCRGLWKEAMQLLIDYSNEQHVQPSYELLSTGLNDSLCSFSFFMVQRQLEIMKYYGYTPFIHDFRRVFLGLHGSGNMPINF